MNNPSWDQIRAFLAVARLGSLSAAARELGVSQPTLTRTIQALESDTGLNLFQRTTQGLNLTEVGLALTEAATCMNAAADQFMRQASGMSEALEGHVRVSANEIVGVHLLPPAVAMLQQKHPQINIEIVISNEVSSLSKREADIALRMFRPQQPDLVARRLPDLALGFFAHSDYICRRGAPAGLADIRHHSIIGFDNVVDFINGAAHLGYTIARKDFALRTDNLLAQIALLRSGAGIGVTHLGLARRYPELVPVLEDLSLPPLEFWCACHRDMQYNARMRAVMQHLGDWFADDPYRRALL